MVTKSRDHVVIIILIIIIIIVIITIIIIVITDPSGRHCFVGELISRSHHIDYQQKHTKALWYTIRYTCQLDFASHFRNDCLSLCRNIEQGGVIIIY